MGSSGLGAIHPQARWRRGLVGRSTAAARRRAALRALRAASGLDLRAQIRRLLALPMAERTHFLRVRLPGGGTAL
jgi:hypothetical protein